MPEPVITAAIVAAVVPPLVKKLLSVVGRGLGVAQKRWMARRVSGGPAVPALPASGSASPTTEVDIPVEWEEMAQPAQRATLRTAFLEEKRQSNIEDVILDAARQLGEGPADTSHASGDPDDDWCARFFEGVKDVSTTEMRRLWGQILAGEVREPGRFSLRTLDVLRQMGHRDAKMFARLAPLFARGPDGGMMLCPREARSLVPYEYADLMTLDELGLLHKEAVAWQPRVVATVPIVIEFVGYAIRLDGERDLDLEVLALTGVGRELATLIQESPSVPYLRMVVEDLRRSVGLTVTPFRSTDEDALAEVLALEADEGGES